jgi:hypothetical protein
MRRLGAYLERLHANGDPDVKKFASEPLPILKKHLELAETTQNRVAGSEKGAARGKSAK